LETGAEVDGAAAGGGGVGACAMLALGVVIEGEADGAATFVWVPVRFATTMPVTTAMMAAITSPIDVIFQILVLSSAMAQSSVLHPEQLPCQRLSIAGRRRGGIDA
jgi:hypothetical protein